MVIGILAAITIVSFNGVTARANYSKEQQDMSSLNGFIQQYYAVNGTYPSTGGSNNWQGWSRVPAVPSLVPAFTNVEPVVNVASSDAYSDTYLYASDGTDYKLIRYSGSSGLPNAERSTTIPDPRRNVSSGRGAWGYWSTAASAW